MCWESGRTFQVKGNCKVERERARERDWKLGWRMEMNGYSGGRTNEDLTDEREIGHIMWLFLLIVL